MKTKRPRDAEEYDEKENIIPNQEIIVSPVDNTCELIKFEIDEKVVQLSRYWPEGLGIVGPNIPPQDKTLLYLFSTNEKIYCTEIPAQNEISEMVRMYTDNDFFCGSYSKYLHYDATFEEKTKFINDNCCSRNLQIILRHAHCPANKKCCNINHYQIRSNSIKIFAVGEIISFYLKIDESLVQNFCNVIDEIGMYNPLVKSYFKGEIKEIEPNEDRIADTFDYPEAQIPEGFIVALRDYQLRTINWMKSIEEPQSSNSNTIYHNISPTHEYRYSCIGLEFKIGDTPYYLSCKRYGLSLNETPMKHQREVLRFYGGILADDTGSGKTITTLGFIHSSPITKKHLALRMTRFKNTIDSYYQSRASCIICPSNIHKQWMQEAKRCNPKLKIYGLSNIHDHKKVSFKDLMEADIVIVSIQFLINTNYCALRKKSLEGNPDFEQMKDAKGEVFLEKIHFYRIIFDEFHEIPEAKNSIKKAIEQLRGDYYWGLTGTPNYHTFKDIAYLKAPERLSTVCGENLTARYEFIRKHMKRNVPDLQLPEIQNEIIWIDFSVTEMNMLKWNSQSSSIAEQIMMCSHYQLSERKSVDVNDFVPVEEAQKRMCKQKEKDIEHLKCKLIQQKASILKILDKDPAKDVSELESNLKSTEMTLQNAQSSMIYFKNVFKIIGEPDANECRICCDNIDESSLAILPCSHLFCYGCITPYVEKSRACPLCRYKITKLSEIYRIRIKEIEQLPENLNELDTSKYSSKLIGLYRYITELIQSDENARIILFLQFSDLANFMEKSFKELKVECVRVVGTVFQRQNAIANFRHSKDVRLIMMSSEDSVSGINLTQATHVILLHPFWTDNGEEVDLAYEKQGISRAYRFGLDHPIKVVRFAVRGTLEEEITLRRQNIKY